MEMINLTCDDEVHLPDVPEVDDMLITDLQVSLAVFGGPLDNL